MSKLRRICRRRLSFDLRDRLGYFPGVVPPGPRPVGKTTLARQLAAGRADVLCREPERPGEQAALAEPELFPRRNRDELVMPGQVQNLPDLLRRDPLAENVEVVPLRALPGMLAGLA